MHPAEMATTASTAAATSVPVLFVVAMTSAPFVQYIRIGHATAGHRACQYIRIATLSP